MHCIHVISLALQVLDHFGFSIHVHCAIHFRRFLLLENLEQHNLSTQLGMSTQRQCPRIDVAPKLCSRREFFRANRGRHVHPFCGSCFRLGLHDICTSDSGTLIGDRRAGAVKLEVAEVGVLDGDLCTELHAKGRRRGRSVELEIFNSGGAEPDFRVPDTHHQEHEEEDDGSLCYHAGYDVGNDLSLPARVKPVGHCSFLGFWSNNSRV